MLRYIALVWNASDGAQADAAQELTRRIHLHSPEWHGGADRRGLKVLYAGARPGASEAYPLNGGNGVVLGTLFERATGSTGLPTKAVLGAKAAACILSSRGQQLVKSYWGRYVAFLHDAATDTNYVLRDPSGGLPCFVTTFRSVNVYFSHAEDCTRLELLSFSVNWRYLARFVTVSLLQTEETGLNEVTELQAGECVIHHQGGATKSFYWHPFDIAATAVIEDPIEAANTLRQTTKACVHAWASCHPTIIHRLSGGLDSSIVLGCLQDAPSRPKVSCLNYYSPGADGDERGFARIVARHAGCEIAERRRNPHIRLEDLLGLARTAGPSFYLGYLQMSRTESELARELGATAIFGGGGGDQLFYQHRANLAAADYVHRHGIRPELLWIALDVSRRDRLSVWRVLADAFRFGLLRRRWNPLGEAYAYRKLVAAEILETARQDRRYVHPWFRRVRGVPPGKYWHAYTLSFPQRFYDPLGTADDPEPVEPLASQPLVELALRIPTYVLTNGGLDRAIARRAFMPDVPRDILRRLSKGGVNEYVKDILLTNIAFVRQLLLDGALIRHGLLDRERLEGALSGKPTDESSAMEILEYVCAEAWLHSWSSLRQVAAA